MNDRLNTVTYTSYSLPYGSSLILNETDKTIYTSYDKTFAEIRSEGYSMNVYNKNEFISHNCIFIIIIIIL